MTCRILIVGGYGMFGGRVAQLLKDDDRLELVIAGRSLDSAQAFCATLAAKANLVPAAFDRDKDAGAQLAALKPDICVDATGPFQSYGDDIYRLVRACVTLGIDYLDLADGSDFVKGIGAFDAAAKAKSVYVLSGVSSFPVLTAAVVRELSRGMTGVQSVTAGIAPSPYANVGLNVIRAISSYAGRPVKLIRDGAPATGYGLVETMRYTIAPPGRMPLDNRRFSLVDVPDLQLLPLENPAIRSVWMGAAPVPEILHRMLNALSWLVRWKLLPVLSPLAPLFSWAISRLRWGEHRGGMFVAVDGTDANGHPAQRSWHLLAEGDDGPLIPSMAVAAVIRHHLDGRKPAAGARAAAGALELADYDAMFAERTIATGLRDQVPAGASLYRRLLGSAWTELPSPIREMHELHGTKRVAGRANVVRGAGLPARLAAWIIGFPPAGQDVPVEVVFEARPDGETWTRSFAGRSFSSLQRAGRGRSEWLLSESFGPVTVDLALVVRDGRLYLPVRAWRFLGIPMPRALAPSGEAFEHAEDGVFHFNVEIRHPLTGPIVRYRGWLK